MPRIGLLTVILLVVASLGGANLVGRFGVDRPVDYALDRDHFKYGSLGGAKIHNWAGTNAV